MAFAPHHNGQVNEHNQLEQVVGQFKHAETDVTFEYSLCTDRSRWQQQDYPHTIYVLDGMRFAQVLKTVAYVIVDEDENGQPVVEKWPLKGHRYYEKAQ